MNGVLKAGFCARTWLRSNGWQAERCELPNSGGCSGGYFPAGSVRAGGRAYSARYGDLDFSDAAPVDPNGKPVGFPVGYRTAYFGITDISSEYNFPDETRWSSGVFEPQHLTNLEALTSE